MDAGEGAEEASRTRVRSLGQLGESLMSRAVVLGGILLGVQPRLARMPDTSSVFGVTDLKRTRYDDDEKLKMQHNLSQRPNNLFCISVSYIKSNYDHEI